jgi:hypothetical protein
MIYIAKFKVSEQEKRFKVNVVNNSNLLSYFAVEMNSEKKIYSA